MKTSVFAMLVSLALAFPSATASADPVLDSYMRDLERAVSTRSMPVQAEREASYIDFHTNFIESDPVRASYYRDLNWNRPTVETDYSVIEAKRAGSYGDWLVD